MNGRTRSPLIKRNSYPQRSAPWTDLPFVADVKISPRKKGCCFWHVPPTEDRGHASEVGRQHAADFAQYLKQNPSLVGTAMLGLIVRDMEKIEPGTGRRWYATGFWSFMEQLIHAAATQTDHYAMAEADAQRYAATAAAYEARLK